MTNFKVLMYGLPGNMPSCWNRQILCPF